MWDIILPMRNHLPRALQRLIKNVSRSFHLTIRVLPRAIRPQIGLAYLLARAADTIADTTLLAVAARRASLQAFRSAVHDAAGGRPAAAAPHFGTDTTSRNNASAVERLLLKSVPDALRALSGFAEMDRILIAALLETITRGQELDLVRFGSADPGTIVALEKSTDLDEYTYLVAGCVGEFWTHMCRNHLFPETPLDDNALLAQGVKFGKGLQLVNILRDIAADLRHGRCYIPRSELRNTGLVPQDLANPAAIDAFRPLYNEYLIRAEDGLAAGWSYTRMLPIAQVRVRLACAWPALIGIKTLARLRCANVLDPKQHVKVSRPEVRHLILSSVLRYPVPSAWKRLFDLSRD